MIYHQNEKDIDDNRMVLSLIQRIEGESLPKRNRKHHEILELLYERNLTVSQNLIILPTI